MKLCGSSKENRCFRGTYRLRLQGNETLSHPSSQRRCASRRAAKRAFSYLSHTASYPRRKYPSLLPSWKMFQNTTFFNIKFYVYILLNTANRSWVCFARTKSGVPFSSAIPRSFENQTFVITRQRSVTVTDVTLHPTL
jgi:hypothetical protein